MKQTLKLHGRTHRAIGSDPIWPLDPWLFNTDNEGGWGYVQFNDTLDLDLLPDPLETGGTWGAVFEDATGAGILIGSVGGPLFFRGDSIDLTTVGGELNLTVADDWFATVTKNISLSAVRDVGIRARSDTLGLDLTDATGVFLFSGGRTISIDAGSIDGHVEIHVGATQPFTVYGDGGKLLEMTEGSPDLHIPSGGTVVADL